MGRMKGELLIITLYKFIPDSLPREWTFRIDGWKAVIYLNVAEFPLKDFFIVKYFLAKRKQAFVFHFHIMELDCANRGVKWNCLLKQWPVIFKIPMVSMCEADIKHNDTLRRISAIKYQKSHFQGFKVEWVYTHIYQAGIRRKVKYGRQANMVKLLVTFDQSIQIGLLLH